MAWIEFSRRYSYDSLEDGIFVPIVLRSGTERADLMAFIDTGASNCVFARNVGEQLGLEIESGEPIRFSTAGGPVAAFGHIVSLEILNYRIETTAYFFANPAIRKNLLGRTGWLDRFRLALVHYDCDLRLAPYDLDSANAG